MNRHPELGDHHLHHEEPGDLLYRDRAGEWRRLGIGAANAVLRVASGLPGWAALTSLLSYATTAELADVAAAEGAGASTTVPRGDHVHAHGSGYLPDAHHAQSHTHDGVDGSGTVSHASLSNLTAGDPHTQYRLESEDHTHASTGLQGGQVDHGALTGLSDDDHPQYATNTEFDDHSARHADGGADEVLVEALPTAATDTALVLKPNGTGGVAFGALVAGDLPEHGASQHTNRTRSIYLYASAFIDRGDSGAPSLSPSAANRFYGGWLFDASTTENIIGNAVIPADWASGSLTFKLYWTNAGAGSGSVVWRLEMQTDSDGGDLNSGMAVTDNTVTAPSQHVLDIHAHTKTHTPSAAGQLLTIIVRREAANVADDLGNDAMFIGLLIEYTADM